jgi:adenosylcobinamide-GDP ribazoletransferase
MRYFRTALMFYTRIPVGEIKNYNPTDLNKASKYFPVVGYIVGLCSCAIFMASKFLFDVQIATILAIVAGVIITGAFHEDGLADAADGFGGGWTKEDILRIMKDSRIGAYAGIALSLLFIVKFLSLKAAIAFDGTWYCTMLVFINYHTLARLTAIMVAFTSEYAREDESSKAKPIATAHTTGDKIAAIILGLLPLLTLSYFNYWYALVVLPLLLLMLVCRNYFNKWLGGYTGDCLGATEQLAEIICLLSFVIICKFT